MTDRIYELLIESVEEREFDGIIRATKWLRNKIKKDMKIGVPLEEKYSLDFE